MDFEEEVEQFCDNYCRYPRICRDQDKLEEKCEECYQKFVNYMESEADE